ncbi:hypothetical protein Tsubulata_010928 [Turnera subulata]|uniref:Chalcone-flavonone isomerase family protein n=1 Tax=Turnera subulata TaxID=218843 RepID=A0A9Q0J027_9ROSI|nr:hypothetical protein Tsubulata_010928 [Turnera subulata]
MKKFSWILLVALTLQWQAGSSIFVTDMETKYFSAMKDAVMVEKYEFPLTVKLPPASNNTFFLGGAGVRGMDIDGKFVKFTAIGLYLEERAKSKLADKWKGKTEEELSASNEFHRDVVIGPFEKFIQVTMILPLTGPQYSEKVAENCVAIWKSLGVYTEEEEKAIKEFLEVFKNETFPPGSSILFTQFPAGALAIAFSKHESFPERATAVINNKLLSESVLESIIGRNGVSPATRKSLDQRMSDMLKNVAKNKVEL